MLTLTCKLSFAGGGGCIRLPRLIGFRQSLGLLVSGQSISAQKALSLGIIDALISNTTCCWKSSMAAYEYTWLLDILNFVKQKSIVKNPVTTSCQEVHNVCSSVTVSLKEEEILSLTEVEINSAFIPLTEYERKFTRKYKSTQSIFNFISSFIINLLFCFIALIKIWKSVGLKMPAPYICLLTTLRCYYSGSWMEAMVINAAGFATVATTAESKSLMNLFLSTRRLKKVALCIGNESSEIAYDLSNTKIFVLVSKKGLKFSAAVIQGLLYSRLSVGVVDVSGQVQWSTIIQEIRKLFMYSVKRGYLTASDVDERIGQLHFCSELRVDSCDADVIIDASIGVSASKTNVIISKSRSEVHMQK